MPGAPSRMEGSTNELTAAFRGCRSEAGGDRALAHYSSSSRAGVSAGAEETPACCGASGCLISRVLGVARAASGLWEPGSTRFSSGRPEGDPAEDHGVRTRAYPAAASRRKPPPMTSTWVVRESVQPSASSGTSWRHPTAWACLWPGGRWNAGASRLAQV
jgi:hypothetical protein